jgi:signal transduction histidine kinase
VARKHLLLTVLGLLSAALFAVVVVDSTRLVDRAFPGFLIWDNGMLLAFHDSSWTGVAAGLPTYGRLLEVDGRPFVDRAALLSEVRSHPTGTPIEYSILVEESVRQVSVPSMVFRLDGYLSTFGIYLFGGAICWLTAIGILYLRGEGADARGVAIMLYLVGLTLVLAVDLIGTSRFGRSLALAEAVTSVAILHFVAVFPRPRLSRRTASVCLAIAYAAAIVAGAYGAAHFYTDPEFSRRFNDAAYLAIAGALLVALAALAHSVATERSSVHRLRAAIVFAGAVTACVVPAVAVPAFFALGLGVSWSLIFAPVFFFPVAVVYAVVRHDLFEAERFIRLSLGYGVASVCATAIFALSLFLLDFTILAEAVHGPSSALIFVFVLAVSFNPLLARTQKAIDRYFYRSVVDPAKVLEELGADLAECPNADAIRARVEQGLAAALGLEFVRFEAGAAVSAALDGELRLPVIFRSEPIGVIVCGPKKSGAPFSRSDRDLVASASTQAGIALRNARSMTDLQLVQAELVRRERLATMGELAGSVAHGVRNPLSGIRASAQIARQQTTDEDLRESLTGIISESDRLESRVRALLDFSRPFQPNLARVDPREVVAAVRRAIEPRAARIGVDLDVIVESSAVLEACDGNFVEEALLELVGNALRTLERPERGRLRIRIACEGGDVVLSVEDSGPGIAAEIQSRIFEVFFTTRAEGTGMGLATVKRIVEALGGSVAVRSNPGEGAIFSIRLPIEGATGARVREWSPPIGADPVR